MDDHEIPTIRSLDALHESLERNPGVCVRYSRGPVHDLDRPSVDHESGLELPGLSANPLEPQPWWTRDVRDWLARQICHYVHLNDEPDRRAWLLVGEVAGYGPDREPLLHPWRPIAFLSEAVIAEARKRYEANFNVGEDSTRS